MSGRIGVAIFAALAATACGVGGSRAPVADAAGPAADGATAGPDGAAADRDAPDPDAALADPDATLADPDAALAEPDATLADAAPAEPDVALPEPDAAPPADDCAAPPADQGEVLAAWSPYDAPPCAPLRHFGVAAAGQDLTFQVRGLPVPARVEVLDVRDTPLAAADLPAGDGAVEFRAPAAGEVRFRLTPAAPVRGHTRYVARLACRAGCGLETTRYPIVLVHGAFGTDVYFGVLEYWFGVRERLTAAGYVVYTPALTPIGASERRAVDLAAVVDAVLAETGAARVHLVGHSQGGVDIRVLLGGFGYGDRVASATSIATPHRGVRLVSAEAGDLVGMPFTEDYMLGEFATRFPEDPSVPRFSWGGATCLHLDADCRGRFDDEVIFPPLAVTYGLQRLRYADDGFEGMNDGLVSVSSAHWGDFLGVLPADHMDQVGQVPGLREGPFDHLAFFLSEARRLRQVEVDHQR